MVTTILLSAPKASDLCLLGAKPVITADGDPTGESDSQSLVTS